MSPLLARNERRAAYRVMVPTLFGVNGTIDLFERVGEQFVNGGTHARDWWITADG